MQNVFQLFDKWAHKTAAQKPRPQQAALLSFDFVDLDTSAENDAFVAEAPPQVSSFSVGRTESCVSAHKLSASHCLEEGQLPKASNLVALHADARNQDEPVEGVKLFRKQRPDKVRATALLDASRLFDLRKNTDAFQRQRSLAEHKDVSLEVLRQLNQRSHPDELLEKCRVACEKVSAEALINSPGRRPQTGPLRQTIRIKIG